MDFHERLAEQLARALETPNPAVGRLEPVGGEESDLSSLLYLAGVVTQEMRRPVPCDLSFKQQLRASLLRGFGGPNLCSPST